MKHEWILDVLVDLISFAKSNGLPKLAGQLETASVEAVTELIADQEQSSHLFDVSSERK